MWDKAMPKSRGAHREKILTARAVQSATKRPGKHSDGAGLLLVVDQSGASRWVLRTVVHGRRRDIGLGGLKDITLAAARDEASRLRKIARAGNDPLVEKRKRAVPDFATAARECYAERVHTWRNAKHQAQWLSSLETYAFPKIGRMRVDHIDTPHIMAILTPIWTKKAETARRVRQRVGLVLDWCKARGFRAANSPTREVSEVLPEQTNSPRHHAALPYIAVPSFIRDLRATGAADATKDALEILILNATRTSETLGARWREVDEENATWTVPAERMKSKRPHTIPLSHRSLVILSGRRAAHSGEGDLIFEAKPGKPLSNMTLLVAMRRMKVEAVPHGFRSSFKDWASERTNAPREVSEACLAHLVPDKTERAYKRTELLQKRRKMMDDWAAWCGGGARVIRFKPAARR